MAIEVEAVDSCLTPMEWKKIRTISQILKRTDLDEEQRKKFQNMKKDFMAHYEQRKVEMQEKAKQCEAAIRLRHKTLIHHIPTAIQNLIMEEVKGKGGLIDTSDGLAINIPKSAVNGSVDVQQMMGQIKKSEPKKTEPFKVPAPVSTVKKSISKRSTVRGQVSTAGKIFPRMGTRSTSKVKKDNQTPERTIAPISALSPDVVQCALDSVRDTTSNDTEESEERLSEQMQAMDLLVAKRPREPKPGEKVIGPLTLFSSATGTPLIVQPKNIERVSKKSS